MGTPMFPNLGKHCSVDDCRQIDFLPFTCDCCQQVYCLDHRSYNGHQCPKANKHNITVVICPLCAKGVRLNPDEDPNITWESHVNFDCDPTNYENATKKRKCPVPRCREMLTFSNTIKCRDCAADHCLKHRFGPDHNCPGPKKPEPAFSFTGFLSKSQKNGPWASSFYEVVSSVRASAGAGIERLSNEFNHVQKVCERNGVMKATINVCPKCSKGFGDRAALVDHVDREHRGVSKA